MTIYEIKNKESGNLICTTEDRQLCLDLLKSHPEKYDVAPHPHKTSPGQFQKSVNNVCHKDWLMPHWKCVSTNTNQQWERVDGLKFTYGFQERRSIPDCLRDLDKKQPIKF